MVGVLGVENDAGDFEVLEIYYCDFPNYIEYPILNGKEFFDFAINED